MNKGRLEAFSDGVIAILITIMVLELHRPNGSGLSALLEGHMRSSLLVYPLSFIFLGIYWNNHHHLFQVVHHVNGAVLWANLHLLFWLSLIPFVTDWWGGYASDALPTLAYGVVLLCAGIAYTILQHTLVALEGPQSALARAIGEDRKGLVSLALYVAAIAVACWAPWIADALYVTVALMWIVPDRRIERHVQHAPHDSHGE
jgi:uncharacterized membrane protein